MAPSAATGLYCEFPTVQKSLESEVSITRRSIDQPALRGLFYWRVIAWWLLAVVVTLSLIPNPDSAALGLNVNDKVAHLLCYAALAFAFGCLRLGKNLGVPVALLMLLGAALEVVQLLSMYGRMFELWDMVANCLGVLLGAALLLTPLRKLFYWFEQLMGLHNDDETYG